MATKLWVGDKLCLVDDEVYDEVERLNGVILDLNRRVSELKAGCRHVWTNGFVENGPLWCDKCSESLD